VHGGLQVHDVAPTTKNGKPSIQATDNVLLSFAVQMKEGLAKMQALDKRFKKELSVLGFGGSVLVPTPLNALPFSFDSITGEDVMRLLLGVIASLRNGTIVGWIHEFIDSGEAVVRNLTATQQQGLAELRDASHALDDAQLFEKLVGYFHSGAMQVNGVFADISTFITTRFFHMDQALVAIASGFVATTMGNWIANLQSSNGTINCGALKAMAQLTATASEFTSGTVVPGVQAYGPNVTASASVAFQALAPDVVPAVAGIMEKALHTAYAVVDMLAPVLHDAKDTWQHLIVQRLCW